MNEIYYALAVLGLVGFSFSFILALLDKRLKIEENPRVKAILDLLPGTNCGTCGFSGCLDFAMKAVEKKDTFSGCIPGGVKVNKAIADILGIEKRLTKMNLVAVCKCGASKKEKKTSCEYKGPLSCVAADTIGAGLDCKYGCLGFGDCVSACPTGAISIKDGKVYINIHRCIACGKCIEICPRGLFSLVPLKDAMGVYYVACSNREKAKDVGKVCTRGCIACGICTKLEDSPFYLKDNLSHLDYNKTTLESTLKKAKEKCPTKCIYSLASY